MNPRRASVEPDLLDQSGRSALMTWAGFSRPARVVGGDFHDVNPLPSGGVDVVVGDVMGKGLPGALLGAACLKQGRPRGRTFDLAHWLASTPATEPDAVVRQLAEHIETVCAESGAPEDDITCVVLGVNPR